MSEVELGGVRAACCFVLLGVGFGRGGEGKVEREEGRVGEARLGGWYGYGCGYVFGYGLWLWAMAIGYGIWVDGLLAMG